MEEDGGIVPPESEGALYLFKIKCIIFISLAGFIGGLLPMKLRVQDRLLSIGNTFSGGIFLAAGFTHMLSEAVEGFDNLQLSFQFPFAYVLCMVGLLLTFFAEKVALSPHHHHHNLLLLVTDEEEVTPMESTSHSREAERSRGIVKGDAEDSQPQPSTYILAALLSLHSIIEGIALGFEDTISDATNILVAIMGHKLFASFALGCGFVKRNIPNDKLLRSVALFALMTPIGILAGLGAFGLGTQNGFMAEAVKALSSGTFIYIALVEVILEEFENQQDKYTKFIALLLGASLMSALTANGH